MLFSEIEAENNCCCSKGWWKRTRKWLSNREMEKEENIQFSSKAERKERIVSYE